MRDIKSLRVPTTMSARIVYYPNSTISGDDDLYGGGDDNISQTANLPWVVVWICALLLFGCTPFCISKKRRQLCRRRIRERRWIVEPDWYDSLLQRQRQRREEMSRQHQEFQISRTQEDEIREQFLLAQLEKYTIVSSMLRRLARSILLCMYVVFFSIRGYSISHLYIIVLMVIIFH